MALWLAATSVAQAQSLAPRGVFLQAGSGDNATDSVTAGATWRWNGQWALGTGALTGYWDASIGRWRVRHADAGDRSAFTQVGVTPVLRYRGDGGESRWFVEAGIGENVIGPVYRSEDHRFSTAFNFGDHLGVGVDAGERHQHEFTLRYEHFSNAGIKEPNPGENFVQLRYTYLMR